MNGDAPAIIAAEIESISQGVKKLLNSRLTERAIVTLIYDAAPTDSYNHKIPKSAITKVLRCASNLKDYYLKKEKELAITKGVKTQ